MKSAGKKIDSSKDYLPPPCFWTTNAFSREGASVTHIHPFHLSLYEYKVSKITMTELSGLVLRVGT